jgi:hypothetical protein
LSGRSRATNFSSIASQVRIVYTDTPDGRRVNVTFHHLGQTFAPKTLRSMIEMQACSNDADLRRLRLIE